MNKTRTTFQTVRSALFWVLFFHGGALLFATDIPEGRKKELAAAISRSKLPPSKDLLPDEIAWVKDYIAGVRKSSDFPSFTRSLVQIGDEAEIKRVMSDYPRIPIDADGVTLVGQPLLIEYMVPTLLLDEPARYSTQGDVTGASPPSTTAALRILNTLSRTWEAPVEVRLWADETIEKMAETGPKGFNSFRAIMRTWWKDNENAVKARTWTALKPGHRFVMADEPPQPVVPQPVVPQPVATAEKVPHNPTTDPKSATAPSREKKDEGGSTAPLWIGGGVLVLLLLGILGMRKSSSL